MAIPKYCVQKYLEVFTGWLRGKDVRIGIWMELHLMNVCGGVKKG